MRRGWDRTLKTGLSILGGSWGRGKGEDKGGVPLPCDHQGAALAYLWGLGTLAFPSPSAGLDLSDPSGRDLWSLVGRACLVGLGSLVSPSDHAISLAEEGGGEDKRVAPLEEVGGIYNCIKKINVLKNKNK